MSAAPYPQVLARRAFDSPLSRCSTSTGGSRASQAELEVSIQATPTGVEALQRFLQEVPAAALPPAVQAALQAACRQQDYWLVVQCGDWEKHPGGWTGLAHGLMQLWRESDNQATSYTLWELDPDGVPTGQQRSGTGEDEQARTSTFVALLGRNDCVCMTVKGFTAAVG